MREMTVIIQSTGSNTIYFIYLICNQIPLQVPQWSNYHKKLFFFIATMFHQPRVFGSFLLGFLIVVTMMTKLSALESEEEVAWLRGQGARLVIQWSSTLPLTGFAFCHHKFNSSAALCKQPTGLSPASWDFQALYVYLRNFKMLLDSNRNSVI